MAKTSVGRNPQLKINGLIAGDYLCNLGLGRKGNLEG